MVVPKNSASYRCVENATPSSDMNTQSAVFVRSRNRIVFFNTNLLPSGGSTVIDGGGSENTEASFFADI